MISPDDRTKRSESPGCQRALADRKECKTGEAV